MVFDECHKAKNLINESGQATKTALAVVALQAALPEARVMYCSATGASEPKNLAYMTRLGSFGFDSFKEMLDTLTSSGMGALEMFALGLKATGSYMCRTLSYNGAEFELQNCPLSEEMTLMYDRSSEFWQMLLNVFRVVEAARSGDMQKVHKNAAMKWAQFWGAHQRFFRQMLLSAKVPALARCVPTPHSLSSVVTGRPPVLLSCSWPLTRPLVLLLAAHSPSCLVTGRSLALMSCYWPLTRPLCCYWSLTRTPVLLLAAHSPSSIVPGRLTLETVYEKNMAVVIGLQSTGEANISQAVAEMAASGEEVDDFVSAPAVIIRNLILKQFPTTSTQSQVRLYSKPKP